MKALSSISSLVAVGLWTAILPTNAQVNVTQYHNHASRDGLYVDGAFTQSAAANLTRDLNFNGTIVGNVYAQPLYIEGGPSGPMVIAVTESNNVYALDAVDGTVIWQRNVGDPLDAGDLPCTKFDPMGIIGTPIVDLNSRALFLDAMMTPDSGVTKKHLIFSLNVDTGDINPGWPVDVPKCRGSIRRRKVTGRAHPNWNVVYAPHGGRFGDCGNYRAGCWRAVNNPASVMSFATTSTERVWGFGGVASDGTCPADKNGRAMGMVRCHRLQPGPVLRLDDDYWAPLLAALTMRRRSRWLGPIVDETGATPSASMWP